MLTDIDVAKYFLNKDHDGSLFNMNLISRNGRNFYEGNARLNKYLHLAQNIYIAKTGEPLMNVDFFAYDNGAVSTDVQENYAMLRARRWQWSPRVTGDAKDFLDRFYQAFMSADIDELIELSHEDDAWRENCRYYDKDSQRMNSMKYAEQYKKQYADMVKVLYRM